MSKSKRLDYSETRMRVEQSHRQLVGEGLGTVQINLLIKHNAWLITELLNKQLKDNGLSAPGYIAMIMLHSQPGYMGNPSDISRCTGETRANMTRICDDLVERGLLQRVPNPEDRRRVDLSLTEAGVDLLKTLVPKARAANKAAFSVLDEEEKETLERLLLKLLRSLEANV